MADSAIRNEIAGKVLQGTCGWSDASIVKCGRFYPASAKSTEDRLVHYSRVFPCVECDSSNYAIPSPSAVERWIKCVPRGFKFHFKAFGLFTRKSVNLNALPRMVRDELPPNLIPSGQTTIDWSDLSDQLRRKLWDRYNSALLPAQEKKKLGVVIFQFHLGFQPCDDNREHILECRRNLDPRYQMAVEFRCRNWLNEQNLPSTSTWLQEANIGLVIADELQNELYFDKNSSTNTPKEAVPIVTALGTRQFMYVRVHRRTGKERILSSVEIKSWGERLRSAEIQENIQGPIYFMWGTDHEDQPIINSKNLTAEIGNLAYDWKGKISQTGLLRFCSPKQEDSQREKNAEGVKEGICSSVSLVATDMVCGGLTESSENAKDESSRTNEKEGISLKEGSSPAGFSADSCGASFSSAVETRKRCLTPSGTKSPKKQRKGAEKKSSLTPPVNQRKISAFFKK